MPYKVAQGAGCPEGKPYAVIKETDGEVMGCHPTKSAANRQLRALYAAEAFNPGQRRDQRGRFARSGTASAALDDLARGNKVDVAPGDVGGILDAAADRSDHPDLTELHVNGTPKFGLDGLGYGRADMPVLGSKHLPGFIAHVSSRGTRVSQERVDPQTLKPMQREVSASSAGKLYRGMRDGSLPDKALVVSIDNFVIDGHHRWGAATALSFERAGMSVPVIRVHMGARALRETALAWNKSERISLKALGESVDDLWYVPIAEHLPGKHNQLAHAKGGSVSGDVARQGGGSYDIGGAPLTTGAVVAIPGHAMSVSGDRFDSDPGFRRATMKRWARENPGSQFGVWDSRGEGGRDIVFDRIENVSRGEAIKRGRERGEDGIFDLDAMEYVPTGGATYTGGE